MTVPLDIAALSRAYADGEAAPEDVLRGVYARIAARGERPDWIALIPPARALERLAEARRNPGPLFGVPFAVKDNIDAAGVPTTAGCPAFAYTPDRSATVVERLEAAGAILVGKTNMDQFATGLVGVRSPYGIPTSVFDPAYVSGGSSSGSAVVVAAGLVSFALGTDTAGSGRVPAAFNNVVGLKPTKGAVSARGVVPACRSQDCVSIFAATADDALAVLDVAAGFDAADPFARQPPPPRGAIPAPLRVGVPAGPLEFFGDDAYAALYAEAIGRLADIGATPVEVDVAPFLAAAALLYGGPFVAERRAALRSFGFDRPEAMHPAVREVVETGDAWSAAALFEAQVELASLTRTAEAAWARMDVLLLPTAPTTYRIADVLADPLALNARLGRYTNFVNLMDLSAVAVPAGFRPDGIPFGVTVVARAWQDRLAAAVADRLHRALPRPAVGATGLPLPPAGPVPPPTDERIRVAVVGAHLSGQPLNWQLTSRGATLERAARTAPGYSLYALAGTVPAKPGLIRDAAGAGRIEVEVWRIDAAGYGRFVADIPAPLGIGTLTLEDGATVQGFLCEPHAVQGARDVTAYGGWRAWLART